MLLTNFVDFTGQHMAQRPFRVLVYSGEGAGHRSIRSAVESLTKTLHVTVDTIGTKELLQGTWVEDCRMLVMPGGADLPYCKALNGTGNRIIRGFVTSGGSYLGLCAGAYYATSFVNFAKGEAMEVIGPRELAFFAGRATGPAYSGFDYASERGAVAARLEFRDVSHELYSNSSMPGSSSVQQSPEALRQCLARQLAAASGAAGGCTAGPSRAMRVDTRVTEVHNACTTSGSANWLQCLDYCNGGPIFETYEGNRDVTSCAGVEVLARYVDIRGAVAALRCRVGSGVAVLCGTHPELLPEHLGLCDVGGNETFFSDSKMDQSISANGNSDACLPIAMVKSESSTPASDSVPSEQQHVLTLARSLHTSPKRDAFWVMLLAYVLDLV